MVKFSKKNTSTKLWEWGFCDCVAEGCGEKESAKAGATIVSLCETESSHTYVKQVRDFSVSLRYYYRILEKPVWRYHLELSVFLRANKDLWNELTVDEMLKARPPVASAVSPEAPPVANDDEVEEGGTLSCKWFWEVTEWRIMEYSTSHMVFSWELIIIE
jgi:hypothetical protein